MQLLFGMIFQIVSILILFVALTYILYEPVRKVLEDRRRRIESDVEDAKRKKTEAKEYKAKYEEKLQNVEKETEAILKEARRKAQELENEIITNAKMEAAEITDRAKKEIHLERKKAEDEIKKQMIEMAVLMAGKMITLSLNEEAQMNLIRETLKEMGEKAWQS